MALVIEDGSVVPGADSFVDVADLVEYAEKYGKSIPTGESDREALLRRAFLEMVGMPWKGRAVSALQSGAWPRSGVVRNGFAIAPDVIPPQVKGGQMALAAEIYADDTSPPESRKGAVTKERVEGAVERQYAEPSASVTAPASRRQSISQFYGLLEGGNQISLVRS